uniref:Homeobox domain-containing protein n=1 Tax=Trichuris muris TaxID=70415 RepID=A0A5S6QQ66_TRIMR
MALLAGIIGPTFNSSNSLPERMSFQASPTAFYVENSGSDNVSWLELTTSNSSNGGSDFYNSYCQNFGDCDITPLLQGGQNFVSVCYGLPGLPARGTYADMGIIGPEEDADGVEKPKNCSSRSRVRLSPYQTSELLGIFRKSPYISNEARKEVAKSLKLTEKQVRLWFQNRRRLNRWNRRRENNVREEREPSPNERDTSAESRHATEVDNSDRHFFDDCSPFSIDYDGESDADLLSMIVSKIF